MELFWNTEVLDWRGYTAHHKSNSVKPSDSTKEQAKAKVNWRIAARNLHELMTIISYY